MLTEYKLAACAKKQKQQTSVNLSELFHVNTSGLPRSLKVHHPLCLDAREPVDAGDDAGASVGGDDEQREEEEEEGEVQEEDAQQKREESNAPESSAKRTKCSSACKCTSPDLHCVPFKLDVHRR